MKYDFSGWATKNDLKCSDGRTIKHNAFKDNDGIIVPLVWNHAHNEPENVIGHATLKNVDEGVRCFGKFNDTKNGLISKVLVDHGDISALSIFANQLKQVGSDVVHGAIIEVSLVHGGANPGAYIDTIIEHSSDSDEEAIIYTGECLEHSSEENEKKDKKDKKDSDEQQDDESKKDKPIEEVISSMNDEQKTVLFGLIGKAAQEDADKKDNKNDIEGGDKTMKHNVFDQEDKGDANVLSHSQMATIIADGKRYGSLKDSFLAHSQEYGIENIEFLFPDAKSVTPQPTFISRDMGWVSKVMGGTHHSPFARIKSIFADITEDDAKAKGYIKGNLKKEEVFSLLKRITTPATVYKKQKLDRDDIVDITDMDVIAWLKSEMRLMLDEEIARSILVGDGRLASSNDKINEENIRPIWKDADLYNIKQTISLAANTSDDDKAKAFVKNAIKARKNYKGSGNPTMFMTEDLLTDCLLLTDSTGRDLYDSVDKLAIKLRVKEIVAVPVMENLTREESGETLNLMGIMVNLNDYNVGADKGGAVNMFDDFDIDYNQQKYLIEARCSGALTVPKSAITIEWKTSAQG